MLRSPAFTLVAVLTLGLGIGGTTAIFSILDGTVLRPVPWREPDRLVVVGWNWGGGKGRTMKLTPAKAEFWETHGDAFEAFAITDEAQFVWTDGSEPEQLTGELVSAGYFRTIGAAPALGRPFLPEESVPGGPAVVIRSDGFWRRGFGADRGVVGRSVTLDGEPYTVVGVMPSGQLPDGVDVLAPLRLVVDPGDRGHNYSAFGRLAAGADIERARRQAAVFTARVEEAYPGTVRGDEHFEVIGLRDYLADETKRATWMVFGAVGFVLLIACANVASLLLARVAARERELAIRAAIGAGRGRIARQLLAESLLLTSTAAVVGLLVGTWGVDGLLALAPAGLPRMDEIGLDGRVLAFTFGVAAVTGTAFGLAAAWHAFQTDLNSSLRDGGVRQGTSRAGVRARSAFVAAQAALAVVLLTGAGLLIASFHRLRQVDLGFEPDGVLAVQFGGMPAGYVEEGRAWEVQRQILERVRAIPGVSAAAATSIAPFSGNQFNFPMTVVGNPEATRTDVQWRSVGPDYFRTLGTAVVRGREFSDADDARATPVAIVNETFVRKYFGGRDPIGQRIDLGTFGGQEVVPGFDDPERVIVGVVADTRLQALDADAEEVVYTPRAQDPKDPVVASLLGEFIGFGALLIRTEGPAQAAPAVLAAIREVDPRLPVPRVLPLREAIGLSIAQERFNMVLLGSFAALALVLTAIGIYGVVAYNVRQRVAEIGIRVALGADRTRVLGMVLRQGMAPVALGLAIGLGAALALGRLIQSLLFGVTPTDPTTILAVVGVITTVATTAILLPARKAAAVDPMVALRSE